MRDGRREGCRAVGEGKERRSKEGRRKKNFREREEGALDQVETLYNSLLV